jgi:hypothetical protein
MPKLYIVDHGQMRLQAEGTEAVYARLGAEKLVKRYDEMFPDHPTENKVQTIIRDPQRTWPVEIVPECGE